MPQRNAATPGRPRVGLVLGSGGARGIVHLSVLEALTDLGIPIDLVVGSSIGAVAAGIHATGRLRTLMEDLLAMKRENLLKLFDPVFSRSGLFAGKRALAFLSRYIPRHVLIEDLPLPLGIVATDYDTGQAVIFRKGSLLSAIRASVSIPGIFMPALSGKSMFVDGGVVNPLPIDVARSMGADLTIAVSLHPALGKLGLLPLRRPGSVNGPEARSVGRIPPVERFVHRLLEKGPAGGKGVLRAADLWLDTQRAEADSRRKVPNLFEIVTRTIDIMENANTRLMLASNPPTVLIDFNLPEIPTLDFSMSAYLFDKGRKAVEAKRSELVARIIPPRGMR